MSAALWVHRHRGVVTAGHSTHPTFIPGEQEASRRIPLKLQHGPGGGSALEGIFLRGKQEC